LSLSDNLRDWKKLVLLAVIVIAGAAYYMALRPSGEEAPEPEVISRRVKIEEAAPPAPVTEAAPPKAQEVAPLGKAARPSVNAKKEAAKPATPPKAAQAPAKAQERPEAAKKTAKAVRSVDKPAPVINARKPWAVNVASFSSLREAQLLASALRSSGYGAYITGFAKDGIDWHRVRVGFFTTRDEAARAGKAISSKYDVEAPWVVKPTRKEAAEYGG
jgi:cell division septation protein DedD